ncbi:tetratricopeptide repeat protein [Streptomyces microflavus]|uniref:tetratricopeptide repeat protein n=1 Tax=Streptomyces microflavus TaxID=1919 RepID=UPI00343235C5
MDNAYTSFDVHGNRIDGPSQFAGTQNNYFSADSTSPPPPGTWTTVERADPLAFGVHRPRQQEGQRLLHPYVTRDIDIRVRPLITRLRRTGGFLVLTGDSTAGKTRCAFEAMRAELTGCRVWAPPRTANLRPIAGLDFPLTEGWVLWLDDVEDYIRDDGLEPALLSGLVDQRVVVLATLRDEQVDRFQRRSSSQATPEAPYSSLTNLGARVLNMAEQIRLDRMWSRTELNRAEELGDPGLEEALRHRGDYGIAEYLGAGPALLDEMNRACRASGNPRGHAYVRAAVDLHRAGLLEIPFAAIEELHLTYLKKIPGSRPEPAAEAFTWATRIHYGATGMINPVGVDSVAWRPFDYLVGHFDRDEQSVHPDTWAIVCRYVQHDFHLYLVGSLAATFGEGDVAESIWRPLADAGNADVLFRLALLQSRQENSTESEDLLRRAADLGHEDAPYGLGLLLREQGRLQECEVQWQRAAIEGNAEAAYGLSKILHEQGRIVEAETWLRAAAEDSHVEALFTLGVLLAKRRQYRESERWLWLAVHQRVDEAEELLETVIRLREVARDIEDLRNEARKGDWEAAFALAEILIALDDLKEAEHWLNQAAYAGHPESTLRYGIILSVVHENHEGGEPWLRRAANAGSTEATYWLGLNLGMQKRGRESLQLITLAARAGHPAAAEHLRNLPEP